MKKILLLIFSAIALNSSGQIAIKGMLFKPTGEFGAVMNKKFTAEILYMGEFDEHWRARAGLSYVPLKPRLDTFPQVAIRTDGNGTTVLPGYQVFHKYNVGYLFGGMDFRFVDDGKFSPYIGMDILMGGINMKYDEYYAEYESASFDGGQLLGGLRFRAGVEYMFTDHLGAFFDMSAAGYFVQESGAFAHYDFGLGIHYVFNPE